MSYDLYLRDPVTKKELQVPAHMMYGGNIRCDVVWSAGSDDDNRSVFEDTGVKRYV